MVDILENIIGIVVFLLLILFSIWLHEYGHYSTAKRFGAKITEFMIGFGPRVWSRRKGETEYGLKALPMGGYVRILGMFPPGETASADTAEEASDSAAPRKSRNPFAKLIATARRDAMEGLEEGEEDRAFYRLPAHKRIIVMVAGPTMNLFLAFLFFGILLVGIGQHAPSTTIGSVMPCVPSATSADGHLISGACAADSAPTAAAQAGIQPGDRLISLNGQPVTEWTQLGTLLQEANGDTMELRVERGGNEIVLTPPITSNGAPGVQKVYLGVTPTLDVTRESPLAVPGYVWGVARDSVAALTRMPQRVWELGVTMATNGERSPESPISVVGASRIGGEVASADIPPISMKIGLILSLAASLNLFLFLFNMLPVLPLDGGHAAAAVFDGIRRKIATLRNRPDPGPFDTARLLPIAYVVGATLLLVGALVIVADILKPISIL